MILEDGALAVHVGPGFVQSGGSPDRRAVSLREVLANLACKLRHLVVWMLSWSYGDAAARYGMVLLCRSWRHYRHDGSLLAVLCDVISAVVLVIVS